MPSKPLGARQRRARVERRDRRVLRRLRRRAARSAPRAACRSRPYAAGTARTRRRTTGRRARSSRTDSMSKSPPVSSRSAAALTIANGTCPSGSRSAMNRPTAIVPARRRRAVSKSGVMPVDAQQEVVRVLLGAVAVVGHRPVRPRPASSTAEKPWTGWPGNGGRDAVDRRRAEQRAAQRAGREACARGGRRGPFERDLVGRGRTRARRARAQGRRRRARRRGCVGVMAGQP